MENILLLIDNLGSGGAQNQISSLAIGLSQKKHNVCLATYNEGDFFLDKLKNADLQIKRFSKRSKLGLSVALQLIRFIKKNRITCLISFLDTPNFYASLCKLRFDNKLKLIVSYRSKTDFAHLKGISLKIKEWVNSKADYIVSNSFHEKETWTNKYQCLKSKWTVIYNTVNFNDFDSNEVLPREKHFLVVGSVGPLKNGLAIIKAIALLKELGHSPKIVWFGKKIDLLPHREKYHQRMIKLLNDFDLNEQWTWQNPTSNINLEYQKCTALILASKTEGLPNVVCEALSCGTPCVVSNVLDHPKIIADRVNGILFDPDKPISLAHAIKSISEMSRTDYDKMSLEASKQAKVLFNNERFINQFLKMIEL